MNSWRLGSESLSSVSPGQARGGGHGEDRSDRYGVRTVAAGLVPAVSATMPPPKSREVPRHPPMPDLSSNQGDRPTPAGRPGPGSRWHATYRGSNQRG